MRARYPDSSGFIERDGVRVAYEVYGEGEPTVLLMPTWSIVHSRHWKMQIAHLARRARVVTFDGRGNGRSDRPRETAAYASTEFVADALAVLDAVGAERAVVAGTSMGAGYALELAATAPERVTALALLGAGVPFIADDAPATSTRSDEQPAGFHERQEAAEGWGLYNAQVWRERYPDFVHFFFRQVFSEPHSTKAIEDCVSWAAETDGETLIRAEDAVYLATDRAAIDDLLSRVHCPALVIHGDDDHISPLAVGEALARAVGAELLVISGGGHVSQARDPVVVNRALGHLLDRVTLCLVAPERVAPGAPARAGSRRSRRLIGAGGVPEVREPVVVDQPIRDFVARSAPEQSAPPVRRWTRALDRRKRILYLSSPIGLGHSRRDVAIVDELRRLNPDVQVDWLAQHPLTELLERRGENIHPASAYLANESAHLESEAAEHDLHAFQSIRSMDEIMVNNFMVFADLVEDQHYDAWVGDEAWELDHFLHENPELKRAPYVWLTDFVGWLPMADGGGAEAALTADYNAEMVEHIARYPRLRDRALFVGNPDDIVPDLLGPSLPAITDWTAANFDFVGYVSGFDPAEVADTAAVRAELGYRPEELVCIVTVGGSGVGGDLLRRVIAAYPLAKRLVPALRMIVVCGPRIDPASLPSHPGLEVRGYVHDLYRHLAVCDLAVVQGGLTTTMELTANRRPFLYVPLRHHFEQNFHVRHRLDRYGAGRCLDYGDTDPEALAHAIAAEISRPVTYRPVETDGARRAAERIAELL